MIHKHGGFRSKELIRDALLDSDHVLGPAPTHNIHKIDRAFHRTPSTTLLIGGGWIQMMPLTCVYCLHVWAALPRVPCLLDEYFWTSARAVPYMEACVESPELPGLGFRLKDLGLRV